VSCSGGSRSCGTGRRAPRRPPTSLALTHPQSRCVGRAVPCCGAFLPSCGSFLHGCGAFLPCCGAFLPSCGAFLHGCGAFLPSCGASLHSCRAQAGVHGVLGSLCPLLRARVFCACVAWCAGPWAASCTVLCPVMYTSWPRKGTQIEPRAAPRHSHLLPPLHAPLTPVHIRQITLPFMSAKLQTK